MHHSNSPSVRVGIVGGGLAGLAAAVALVEHGCSVDIFEARRRLGGRAGSYLDPVDGATIDHCQHVAMGCCTNFLDLCRRTGIDELLERHETLHFFGPAGRRSDFRAWKWLPAPLHLLPPLSRLSYLSLSDKVAIARAMTGLVRGRNDSPRRQLTVSEWLQANQQPPNAIERFWKVVLISALGESLERASVTAACKVFLDGFLAHPDASDVWVPRAALDELYDKRLGNWLTERGAAIAREAGVAAIELGGKTGTIRLRSGEERRFDFLIGATEWTALVRLLPPDLLGKVDPHGCAQSLGSSPITSVHLWFDQPITDLPHAVLVERLSQWVFQRPGQGTASEHYYQVVISASHDLAGRTKDSIVAEVTSDLRGVFPGAVEARLLRWRVITDRDAVFSMRPGIDDDRPGQRNSLERLFLAGDWTRTGWPATMEGAVRSGYLAAEAVLDGIGRPAPILKPGLPCGWLVRCLT